MSASTLDRAFKGLPRVKPFAVKANRRSGVNRPILDAIECKSGEEVMACHGADGTSSATGNPLSGKTISVADGAFRHTLPAGDLAVFEIK